MEYIRRILVESDAAVQIYRLAKYHGYTRRQADTAFKVNNTWLKRRGLRLQPAGPRGSGHVVVDSDGAPVRKSDVRRKV